MPVTHTHTHTHIHAHMHMYTSTHPNTNMFLISVLIVAHPETSQDFAAIHGEHRRRSLSATYQRRTSLQEGAEPRFGRTYPDTNEDFFSLPPSTALKPRPSFVHLIHSNSAPVVMSDDEGAEGGAVHRTGSFRENGNGGMSEWEWSMEYLSLPIKMYVHNVYIHVFK